MALEKWTDLKTCEGTIYLIFNSQNKTQAQLVSVQNTTFTAMMTQNHNLWSSHSVCVHHNFINE
jgi:hypothetical protein